MTDYNKLLIDLLNEKVCRLIREKDEQRKEIGRLKAEIKKMRKGFNADEG